MKISFVGLYEESNLGDPVIAQCTEWLFSKQLGNKAYTVNRVTLDYGQRHPSGLLYKAIKKFAKTLHLSPLREKISRKQIWRTDLNYFSSSFRDSAYIVVVGGGLIKYKYQYFWLHLPAILHTAQKLGIPVFFNALGVEGFEKSNECLFLKESLHKDCLKRITIRDDYSLFFKKYLDSKPFVPSKEIADPAVWAKDAFSNTLKKISNVPTNIIGLGIARGEIFKDNGISLSKEKVKHFYTSIGKILTQSNYSVQIFTNGLKADNEFAKEIFTELQSEGISLEKPLLPSNKEELVHTIGTFKAVIATRLHSCIIAYSLNKPAIGIVWNEKLALWGNKIGAPQNFLTATEWNESTVLSRLEKALATSYNENIRQELKESVFSDIGEIAKQMENG